MKMRGYAGSRRVILLIIAIAAAAMVGTCAAAQSNAYTEQQQLLRMYDILLRGVRANGIAVDDNLSCTPSGQSCVFSFNESKDQCCPGSRCTGLGPFTGQFACQWCPSEGDTCGALDHCCPHFHCVGGPFSGTCARD